MAAEKTAYELEREARIEANKRKIAELGIHDSVAAVQDLAGPKPTRPKRKAPAPAEPVDPADLRRSGRPRTEVNYAVDLLPRGTGTPREPIDYTEKIKSLQLDSEEAEKLRAELEAKREEGGKKERKSDKSRGPKDSGKGVRVQGGRVYDSKFGVTCHWCRQKTLEAHVSCTHPKCAKGKMPYSFCHKCLKNRHGEDAEEAAASGCWVCPTCRGSCGAGCVMCCNCGPCRKKAGLEPTAQIVFLARSAGFGNVHDYLVHLVTGEKEEDIAARKAKAPWGGWLRGETTPMEDDSPPAGEGGEEKAKKKRAPKAPKEPKGEEAEAGGKKKGGKKGAAAEEEDASGSGAPAAPPSAGKAAGGAKGKGRGRKSSAAADAAGGDAPATAAAAAAEPAAGGKGKAAAKGKGAGKAAKGKGGDQAAEEAGGKAEEASASPPDVGAPASQDQDQEAKLSRKERMMQRMGLAGRA